MGPPLTRLKIPDGNMPTGGIIACVSSPNSLQVIHLPSIRERVLTYLPSFPFGDRRLV